jgi:putative ABC transport system permease protein
MKFWDIVLTANANLRRNKLRTALTIIAVFIGALTITLTAAVNAGVNDYIDRQLGNVGGENMLEVTAKQSGSGALSTGPQVYDPDAVVSSDSLGLGITMLTDKDVNKIKEVNNVDAVIPGIVATPTYVQGESAKKYKMTIGQMVEGLNVDVAVGDAPDRTAKDYQVTLQYGYATALGFANDEDAIGKNLKIVATTPLGTQKTLTARIVGVLNNSLISQSGALVNDSLNNAVYDVTTEGATDELKHRYIALVVLMKDFSNDDIIQKTKEDITALDQKKYSVQTVSERIGVVSSIINAITIALIGFGAIALIAAAFGVVNTLFMAVQERTREIGLMKAVGMSSRSVFMLFSFEAILIGFWGSLLGVVVAVGIGQVVNDIAKDSFLKDLTGFTLMQFPIHYLLLIVSVIMLITYLAGTLPARRASKQNPIDALRYE